MKLILGVYYTDLWLITLAVYYLLLAVMRFLLLIYVKRETVGQNQLSEWGDWFEWNGCPRRTAPC